MSRLPYLLPGDPFRPRRLRSRVVFAGVTLGVAAAAMTVTAQPAAPRVPLRPAITAAAALRPAWDGRRPAVWTGDAEPLCARRYAGRTGTAADPETGVRFVLRCDEGSWTVVGG